MPEKDWVSVSLPDELVKEIDAVLEKTRRWTSRAEFIREAVRQAITAASKIKKEAPT